MADDALIAAAKAGDQEAWRELYRAHAGRLVLWLETTGTGDAAVTAEDLAAEAWLTAAQKVADFAGDGAAFAGWLFGIARNLARNTRRRSARRSTSPVADHAPGAEPLTVQPPAEDEAWVAGREWVRAVLDVLPPREREVVGCTDVVGLDVETTARALGISPVAVRVARHRGLRRLRAGTPPAQPAASPVSTSR